MYVASLAGQGEGHTVAILVARIFLGGGAQLRFIILCFLFWDTKGFILVSVNPSLAASLEFINE